MFELLAGQRRLIAAKKLGWTEIRATIIEKPANDLFAKAISFIENEMREKMTNKDLVVACNEFYGEFGTIKDTAKELALPEELVSAYVKLPRIPKIVREAVKNAELDARIAIKATDALRWDSGTIEEGEKVLQLAERMQEENMSRDLVKAIVDIGSANPSQTIETIVEKAEKRKNVKVTITLASDEIDRLDKYAKSENSLRAEVAANLILEGLDDHNI